MIGVVSINRTSTSLDAKSKTIIELLQRDGRRSYAEIGKAVGKEKSQVSRIMDGERDDPEVKSRIQKLLAEKAGKPVQADEPARKAANG